MLRQNGNMQRAEGEEIELVSQQQPHTNSLSHYIMGCLCCQMFKLFKPPKSINLNLSLSVQVWLVLAQQFSLVGFLVGLQVLSVMPDVGPGPHATDTSDANLHDAVKGIPPPGGESKCTTKPSKRFSHKVKTLT